MKMTFICYLMNMLLVYNKLYFGMECECYLSGGEGWRR
jgi:hypothetical protein